jgi:hypothetical protein
MKLATFMEKHTLVLVIGSVVIGFLLGGLAALLREGLFYYILVGLGLIFLFVMPFVCAFGGSLLYSINNASLRRKGKRATAIILDSRWTGGTDGSGRDISRFKLEVHPIDEPSFVAVAEDSYYIWDFIDGQEVNVWYDPITKDVALEKPRKIKEKNF